MAHQAFLAIHIAAGSLGLVLGPIAMLAPKRRGRHTRIGDVYHWNMLVVCVSAVALALLGFSRIWWFIPIAAFSYGNALVGYLAVKRRRPGWLGRHIAGMGGSYIALTTALLVVNAGVSAWWAWSLPTIVGTVLIRRAVAARIPAGVPRLGDYTRSADTEKVGAHVSAHPGPDGGGAGPSGRLGPGVVVP